MKKSLFIAIAFLLISCTKKEIKIPTLPIAGIQEIQNHSQVWIFLENNKNDTLATVNRKNTISSTHWIYNIDKNLTLKKIIPELLELKDKHHNSMHSEKGMHDYFSYSDTISKKLSFIEFDNVIYIQDNVTSKYLFLDSEINEISIHITICPSKVVLNDTEYSFNEFSKSLIKYIEQIPLGTKITIYLNFNEDISYQQYLYNYSFVYSIKNDALTISNNQYIFNQNKTANCGC